MDFYFEAARKALEKVEFVGKEKWHFDLVRGQYYMMLEVRRFELPNYNAGNFQASAENKTGSILHKIRVEYRDVPFDAERAVQFFIKLFFRAYMEFEVHELMEGFFAEGKRYRNPHEDGTYLGSRVPPEEISVYSSPCWRNHAMWEACRLIAEEKAPDLRSKFVKLVDLTEKLESELIRFLYQKYNKLRFEYFCLKSRLMRSKIFTRSKA